MRHFTITDAVRSKVSRLSTSCWQLSPATIPGKATQALVFHRLSRPQRQERSFSGVLARGGAPMNVSTGHSDRIRVIGQWQNISSARGRPWLETLKKA